MVETKVSVAVAPDPIAVPEPSGAEKAEAPEPKDREDPTPSWIGPGPVFRTWSVKDTAPPGRTAPGARVAAT